MYPACRYKIACAADLLIWRLIDYEQSGSACVFIEIKGGATLFMVYLYGINQERPDVPAAPHTSRKERRDVPEIS